MGGNSSSSGDSVQTKRYAPYIEARHSSFLGTVASSREIAIGEQPYAGYSSIDANAAFFGAGVILGDLPSIYDTFGRFMLNLDISAIWNDVFSKTLTRAEIDESIAKEVQIADDSMVSGPMADFQIHMRNINAVDSSSFVIGKAVMEDKRVKALMAVSLSVKERLMPTVSEAFAASLNWNSDKVKRYALVVKRYMEWKTDSDETNYAAESRKALWPFTVLSFEGAALGTMRSAMSWQKALDPVKRSAVSGMFLVGSYAAQGAAIGFQVGAWYGAAVGAVVGVVVGIAMLFSE